MSQRRRAGQFGSANQTKLQIQYHEKFRFIHLVWKYKAMNKIEENRRKSKIVKIAIIETTETIETIEIIETSQMIEMIERIRRMISSQLLQQFYMTEFDRI
jgi:hypothetical protein